MADPRDLVRFSLNQRVLVDTAFVALCIAGIFAIRRMPVEEYPNVSFDQIKVIIPFPGASPEQVEDLVIRKVEDAVREVDDLEWTRSDAFPDRAELLLKFRDGTDVATRERDVQNEINQIPDLPARAEEPKVFKIDVEEVNPVIHVVVSGPIPEGVMARTATDLADELGNIDGVVKVKIQGERKHELRVLCDPDALAHHDLTVADVAGALRRHGASVPAGLLQTGTRDFLVRATGEFETGSDVAAVVVKTDPEGSFVRVADVARLERGFERQTILAKYRQRRALTLGVIKNFEGNAVEIAREVRTRTETFRSTRAPPGVELDFVADSTKRIKERTEILVSNIYVGLILVSLCLWVFIGWRNAVLAVIGIPFCFLLTFAVMRGIGESINAVSLFSLVLVLGVIVDDAIVILENIHRHLEDGVPLREAIVEGTGEVITPVSASTATTIAAFLPMLLMSGPMGRFFSIIPKTVAFALIASLFEAFVILPAHAMHLKPGKRDEADAVRRPWFGRRAVESVRGAAGRGGVLLRAYSAVLKVCLTVPWVTLLVMLLMGIVAAFALGRVPVHLFPSEYQQFFVNVTLPPGAPLSETEALVDRVDQEIWKLSPDLVESSLVTVGMYFDWNYRPQPGSHYGQLLVAAGSIEKIKARYGQDGGTKDVMEEVRRRLAALDLGRASVEVVELNDGPPIGRPIAVRIRGDDLEVLNRVSRVVMNEIDAVEGTKDVRRDLELGYEEVAARLRTERAGLHGIALVDVATALADAIDGAVAATFREGDDEVDVRVRLDPAFVADPGDLAAVRVRNRHGELTEIGDVATLDRLRGPLAIHRFERRRSVNVTADIDPHATTSSEAVGRIADRLEVALPPETRVGYRLEWEGEFEETNKSFDSLKGAFLVALIILYGLLAAQFRSAAMPVVVLLTVPFSFVGVVIGLYASGDPFTIATFIAIIGLSGMVVNDSLVLLEFARAARARGMPPYDAFVDAGEKRMRAILLTTTTTVFGLLPMAIGFGGRSLIWGPMATAIVFGLSFATVLTLLVIPSAALIVERWRVRLGFVEEGGGDEGAGGAVSA